MFLKLLYIILFIVVIFFFKPGIDKKIYSYLPYLEEYRKISSLNNERINEK